MKIAQISPLYESVPPLFYGGTERIVGYLSNSLMEMGHDVTLFASGDSDTTARLVPCCRNALRLDKSCIDPLPHHLLMLEKLYRIADRFDIIHFHIEYLHFSMIRRLDCPTITTLHGRLDIPDLVPLYNEFADIPVVSISGAQRKPLPWINWQGTVYHGISADHLPYNANSGTYLAFLGRISPEKGLDAAIAIARESGISLKIAAKIDRSNHDYFEARIKPLLDEPFVEYVGEISEEEKKDFLGGAMALLFPIDWEEPFGLAMIESMACGTPVIAYRRGSVPEVVTDGVSGYIVDDLQGAVEAVRRLHLLSRKRCRDEFERRFRSERMAADYLNIYQDIADVRHSEKESPNVLNWRSSGGGPKDHRCVTLSR